MKKIEMVDLKSQYLKIKDEIDTGIFDVITSTEFVKGSKVKQFENNLARYLNVKHVITCANGTDALQIALMALQLSPEDEIITTPFTFIATAEVIALLGLKIVLIDVDNETYNISPEQIEKVITPRTKAIIPVHLFGQSCDMEQIMKIANKYNLKVIEDNAQGLGGEFNFSNHQCCKLGSIGSIGCTSFFPSKNLGCFGDGGAMFTNDNALAERLKMISNHGMKTRYYHDEIGVNSRLDTIQAAILDVKLKYLQDYIKARKEAARIYNEKLQSLKSVKTPLIKYDHVFHQYTIVVKDKSRDELRSFLESKSIPSMVYYPVPIHLQKAFNNLGYKKGDFPVTEYLSEHVLSLPMHTELTIDQQEYICNQIFEFFN